MEDEPTITHDKITTYEKFKEVHSSMMRYPEVVYNRLQTGLINDGRANPKYYTEETPAKWFFKKSSTKIWSQLSGYSSHFILNPLVQKCIVASMLFYMLYLGIYALVSQRQIKLPSWLACFDGLLNDYYTKSILYFFATVLIQLKCLSAIPNYVVSMPDISGTMYFGVGLVSVFIEACTWRFNPMVRRIVTFGLLIGCLFKFSQYSQLIYGGDKWNRNDCEKSGFDIDCIRFPLQQLDAETNSTMTTVYVELAGSNTKPYKYYPGEEVEADQKIASMKQESFEKEAERATGVLRYHRVMPTPAITPEEAAQWAKTNLEKAVERTLEAKRKKEEEDAKKEEAKKKKKEDKKVEAIKKLIEEQKANLDVEQKPAVLVNLEQGDTKKMEQEAPQVEQVAQE